MSDQYHISGPHLGPCGLALLINICNITRISKVDGKPEKVEREGSNKDKKKMEDLFQFLNFEVDVKEDLTRNEIVDAIIDFSKKLQNNSYDICAVCIMSHGDNNLIEGSDGYMVNIEKDIFHKLSNDYCRSMTGKPKFFVFQACRGTERDPGYLAKSAATRAMTDAPGAPQRVASVLEDAIMAYPCIPDYAAWRNSVLGSHFINSLCKIFKEHAATLEINDMLNKVKQSLKEVTVKDETLEYKITPTVESRLDRKLFFKPKNKDVKNEEVSSEDSCEDSSEDSNAGCNADHCCLIA